jgi:glucokinase-like ROK family protein
MMTSRSRPEDFASLSLVLELVRSRKALSQPEIMRLSGLGRTVVARRVSELKAVGLLEEGELGLSTGGRAPRQLTFHGDAGVLLVAELGASSLAVGVADLTGRLLKGHEEPARVFDDADPELTLSRVASLFDDLYAGLPVPRPPIWGIGIGVLGPVDAETARPARLPMMPGWGDYPIRELFGSRYGAPVWVDNEVNLMALGEYRQGVGKGIDELIFIKVGQGLAAGIIAGGRLQRGAQGAAGEVGHIRVVEDESVTCWCGNTGCLVQLAGGAAIARDAVDATPHSPYLQRVVVSGQPVDARTVAAGAAAGDPACLELLIRAGRYIGQVAAILVNVCNPAMVIIGGAVARAGDPFLAAIRQEIYRQSFPLASRDLRVSLSPLSDTAGLVGAAFMVSDELMSPEHLPAWIDHGTPAGLQGSVHADSRHAHAGAHEVPIPS